MRKEVLVAILLGGIFGLLIAFGIWRINKIFLSSKSEPSPSTASSKAVVDLSIATPNDRAVLRESLVIVSGVTRASALVAISSETYDYILEADSSGEFSFDVELAGGLNEIKVFSFSNEVGSKEKSILIVYSSEFPTAETSASENTQSTSEREIRERVREKIEEKLKSPIAILGVVTDIASQTIQIKDDSGEIKQLSANKETTTFVKRIDPKSSKSVSLPDLAIGDFILAMGLKNGNGVLDAKRVLITPPFVPSNRTALIGEVTNLTKSSLELKKSENDTALNISIDSSTRITQKKDDKVGSIKLSNLIVGDKIVVAGSPDDKRDNTILARRIHKLD